MDKWAKSSKGIFVREEDIFYVEGYPSMHSEELHKFITDICEYRLHAYFERGNGNPGSMFGILDTKLKGKQSI
ncbi:hypothetical protein ACFQ4Y_15895 [Kroppenstedtia sanguinis]|uniref:Uncharacterized protein n=1 Tax=Kroppenstedtia sanguinis TaxID=1380684 RepID=A0ABW4CFQ7_9BACL